MSSASTVNKKPVKTRDIIKYMFAAFLGVMTIIAIGGLFLARYQREKTSEQEELHIRETLLNYGQNGALPEKLELPEPTPSRGVGTP